MRVFIDWIDLKNEMEYQVAEDIPLGSYVQLEDIHFSTVMSFLFEDIYLYQLDDIARHSFNNNYITFMPTEYAETLFRTLADKIRSMTVEVLGREIDRVLDRWYFKGRFIVIEGKV